MHKLDFDLTPFCSTSVGAYPRPDESIHKFMAEYGRERHDHINKDQYLFLLDAIFIATTQELKQTYSDCTFSNLTELAQDWREHLLHVREKLYKGATQSAVS